MAITPQVQLDPQKVRSHARGRGFWTVLIAAWPVGLVVGLVLSLVLGGLAVGIASGLAVALGIDFVWVVMAFAVDDGDVNDRVQDSRDREAP